MPAGFGSWIDVHETVCLACLCPRGTMSSVRGGETKKTQCCWNEILQPADMFVDKRSPLMSRRKHNIVCPVNQITHVWLKTWWQRGYRHVFSVKKVLDLSGVITGKRCRRREDTESLVAVAHIMCKFRITIKDQLKLLLWLQWCSVKMSNRVGRKQLRKAYTHIIG